MPRLLIVDDSPTQAAAMRMVLEKAGHTCETAADGRSALERIRAGAPGLVVTGLHMQNMDGLARVEEIRRDSPAIPVVLATAFGSEEIASKALRAGAASYVPKRNVARDLAEVVAQVLA